MVLNNLGRDEKWTNITCTEYEEIKNAIEKELNSPKYSAMRTEIGALVYDDIWVNDEMTK